MYIIVLMVFSWWFQVIDCAEIVSPLSAAAQWSSTQDMQRRLGNLQAFDNEFLHQLKSDELEALVLNENQEVLGQSQSRQVSAPAPNTLPVAVPASSASSFIDLPLINFVRDIPFLRQSVQKACIAGGSFMLSSAYYSTSTVKTVLWGCSAAVLLGGAYYLRMQRGKPFSGDVVVESIDEAVTKEAAICAMADALQRVAREKFSAEQVMHKQLRATLGQGLSIASAFGKKLEKVHAQCAKMKSKRAPINESLKLLQANLEALQCILQLIKKGQVVSRGVPA